MSRPQNHWWKCRARLAVLGAALLFGIAALVGRILTRHAPVPGLDEETRAIVASADRVEAFELVPGWHAERPSVEAAQLAEGMWRRGRQVVLPAELAEEARRAVLSPANYDAEPTPDLCAFEPTWGIQFIRADREVSVLVDRACWRAHVSGAHARGGSPWSGPGGGGGKLSGSGHAAFLSLHEALGHLQMAPARN